MRTVPTSCRKMVETEKIDDPNYIHRRSHFWLGTETLIKGGGV